MKNCKILLNFSKKQLFEENFDAYDDKIYKDFKKKSEDIPNNIELEDSHNIFAPISKIKKIKHVKEDKETSIVKSILGRKILTYLKDKNRKNIFANHTEEEIYYTIDVKAKYNIPIISKRQIDRYTRNYKVKYTLNPHSFEALENHLFKLRGERIKKKEPEVVNQPKPVNDSDSEDIF